MKTLRRLFYGEVFIAIAFVTLGFLGLFYFFDFVEELQSVTRSTAMGYKLPQALLYTALMLPSHLYELLPITVLIGTIFVMARLAQSSEFTILRTSGLGPWRALQSLLVLGVVFVALTFATGEYLAPLANKTAHLMKNQFLSNRTLGKTGAWLKEKQESNHYAVNVSALSPSGDLENVRILEFDNQGFLVSTMQAALAQFDDASWFFEKAERTEFIKVNTPSAEVRHLSVENFRWPTKISAEMVAAAVLKPERMSTIDLFQYIRHLKANGQTTQKYQIQFWKKVFYPLSCLVMVVLALPFAYLHFRSGNIATYVFVGVMVGISFVLLNNVLVDLGGLQGWQPWLTAALPGLIYSLISLSAFTWLVIRQ